MEIDQVEAKTLSSDEMVKDKIPVEERQSSRSLPDLEPRLYFEPIEEDLTR